ncbi:MAG: rhodanese-like domain-containing protein [Bacteroidota bacterium]
MTLNKLLVGIVLVLSLLAASIGTPQQSEVNVPEIAALIESEQDHITPLELAEQLYAGKKIRLIDLRDSSLHALNTIADAENMTLQELLNGGIKRNEVVVLYSEGGIHASQAWMLLKMKYYDSVYTLLGGFAGWKEEILYPTLKIDSTYGGINYIRRRKALSYFFGGEPNILSAETALPKTARQKQQPPNPIPLIKFQKEEEKLRDQC